MPHFFRFRPGVRRRSVRPMLVSTCPRNESLPCGLPVPWHVLYAVLGMKLRNGFLGAPPVPCAVNRQAGIRGWSP